MKKLITIVVLAASAVTAPAYADSGTTLLGAAIGGATGAIVGRQVAGRDGVILGAAIGGAAGAAIGRNAGERRQHRYVEREAVYVAEPAYYAQPAQPVYYERRVVQQVYEPQPAYSSERAYYPAAYAYDDGRRHEKCRKRHHRHWHDD